MSRFCPGLPLQVFFGPVREGRRESVSDFVVVKCAMPRATEVVISLPALRHNLRVAASCAPRSKIWAVVKADAYGHGLEAVLSALNEAHGLALVEFDRARRLRDLGCAKPILMLEGAFEPGDLEQAANDGLSLVVHEAGQLDWLARFAAPARIDVYLKLNSGMNRLGLPPVSYSEAWARLRALPVVGNITLMTHFANADLPGGTVSATEIFERASQGLVGERSLANSAAILSLPKVHANWIRPGIMLYGSTPFADRSARSLGLRPVMTLQSRLIAIQSLAAGEAVGYGSTFIAERPMRVGIVACGYADGYPRHAPTGTPVAVNGMGTRTVGRVSMDMLAVDLGPIPQASVGDPVELWGECIPVDDVAAAAGTIGYELTCAIAPRVRRRVADDGQPT